MAAEHAFSVARTRYLAPLGRDHARLSYLLGSTKATRRLFDFINDTGRLRGTYGALEFTDEMGDAMKKATRRKAR